MGAVAVRHDPVSAALVRRAIAEDLVAHAVSRDSIEDVVLVASELVGNAVIHAASVSEVESALDISWQIEPDSIVVTVGDGSTTGPRPRRASAEQTSGRGLAIVAALAREWGVEPTGTGKRVWARVPISPA